MLRCAFDTKFRAPLSITPAIAFAVAYLLRVSGRCLIRAMAIEYAAQQALMRHGAYLITCRAALCAAATMLLLYLSYVNDAATIDAATHAPR